jgi:hypothetical protein
MFSETQIANPFPFTWNLEWEDFRDTSVLGLIASNIVVGPERYHRDLLVLHHRNVQKCLQEIYRGSI